MACDDAHSVQRELSLFHPLALLAALLLVAIAGPASAASAPAPTPNHLNCDDADACLAAALQARARGDETAALAQLDQLLALHPGRLRARAERALSLYRLHRMQESIEEIDRLLQAELPANVRGNLLALRNEAKLRLGTRNAARYALRVALGHDDNVAGFADYDTRLGNGSGLVGSGAPILGTVGGSPDEFVELGGRLRWRGQGFDRLQGRADVDLNVRRHRQLDEFDLTDLRMRAGAEWRATPLLGLSLTPALRHIRRADDALLSDGSLEFAAGVARDPWGLRLGIERLFRRYDSRAHAELEADHWALLLRSQWLMGIDPQWWFGADLEFREETARDPAQDRDLERFVLNIGHSRGRHELSFTAEGNWYRYRNASGSLQLLNLSDPGNSGDSGPQLLATGVTELDYRSAEARWRFNFGARWSVQVRLRRLLAGIGDSGPSYDRTSLDLGFEWNR